MVTYKIKSFLSERGVYIFLHFQVSTERTSFDTPSPLQTITQKMLIISTCALQFLGPKASRCKHTDQDIQVTDNNADTTHSGFFLHEEPSVYTRHTCAAVPSDVSQNRDFRKLRMRLIVNTKFIPSTYALLLHDGRFTVTVAFGDIKRIHLIHSDDCQKWTLNIHGSLTKGSPPLSPPSPHPPPDPHPPSLCTILKILKNANDS